ncbi:MAG: MBL fold metallo-hydrolase [Clostridiales bacterium]|nr:MBL fold metallo-hydrolase [Clostridiales bacterium]
MSLQFCVIASGSKGNCCYVSDGTTDILIDLGISATRAEKCLGVLGVNPDNVRILVTHSHSDHIGGLKIFCKKHGGAKVICQKEVIGAVAQAEDITPLVAPRNFRVGGMYVTALPVSHDVPCFGYVVSDGTHSVAVVTDIGTVSMSQLNALSACGIVMLESNHDVEMLKANPRYSAPLKRRILSDNGHLSNVDCASACAYLAGNGVKRFILAHLSEENNDPELAVKTVMGSIADAGVSDFRVTAAKQDAMSGLYEVC